MSRVPVCTAGPFGHPEKRKLLRNHPVNLSGGQRPSRGTEPSWGSQRARVKRSGAWAAAEQEEGEGRERGAFTLTPHPSDEELLPPLPVCGGPGLRTEVNHPGQAATRRLHFLLLRRLSEISKQHLRKLQVPSEGPLATLPSAISPQTTALFQKACQFHPAPVPTRPHACTPRHTCTRFGGPQGPGGWGSAAVAAAEAPSRAAAVTGTGWGAGGDLYHTPASCETGARHEAGRSDPTPREMPPSPSTPHLGRLFPQREAATQARGCRAQGEPQVHRAARVRPCMGQGEDGLSPAHPTGPESRSEKRVSAPLHAARAVMGPERLVRAKDSRPLRKVSKASGLVSSGPRLTNSGPVSPEQPAGGRAGVPPTGSVPSLPHRTPHRNTC